MLGVLPTAESRTNVRGAGGMTNDEIANGKFRMTKYPSTKEGLSPTSEMTWHISHSNILASFVIGYFVIRHFYGREYA
jgi:hypothetical protein